MLHSSRLNKKEQALLFILVQDALFGEGHITRRDIAETMEISTATVNALIAKLSQSIFIACKKEGKHNVYELDLNSLEEYIKNI